MMTFGGIAKYSCQNCKKRFFIKLIAGGFMNARAHLPQEVKCPQCGSKNVRPSLLSRLIY